MEPLLLNEKKTPDEKIEEPTLAPVVTGKVSIKQKSEGRKLMETFFKGNLEQVKRGVWWDVVVPTVMDLLWNALERAGRGLIYGDSDRGYTRDRDRGSSAARPVDFTAFSKRDRDQDRYRRDNRCCDPTDVYDYGELRFEYTRDPAGQSAYTARRNAEKVLASMEEVCDSYKWVSVAQMLELAGLEEFKKWTDRDWGWRDLRGAEIIGGHSCYILKLTRPKPRLTERER